MYNLVRYWKLQGFILFVGIELFQDIFFVALLSVVSINTIALI